MTGTAKGIRVGTLNVRSLTAKVGAVAALATAAEVNVLALQETMVAADSFRSGFPGGGLGLPSWASGARQPWCGECRRGLHL